MTPMSYSGMFRCLLSSSVKSLSKHTKTYLVIHFYEFYGIPEGKNRIILYRKEPSSDNKQLYLGGLYFGECLSIPRFIANPTLTETFTTESDRTFGGFAYGLSGPTLREISLDFRRVNKIYYLKILDYLRTVGKTMPHFIDIYEDAHDVCPPLYGTFSGDFEPVKRAENDFYFDFSLQYLEAK